MARPTLLIRPGIDPINTYKLVNATIFFQFAESLRLITSNPISVSRKYCKWNELINFESKGTQHSHQQFTRVPLNHPPFNEMQKKQNARKSNGIGIIGREGHERVQRL